MNDTEPVQRAHAAALRYLSYRPRSEAEVRARLRRRYSESLVEQVLELLRDESMVDDAKFAAQWRDSRSANNPRSALAVKRELIAKGVDNGVAQEAVQGVDDGESAYRAGLKQARKYDNPDIATFRRRLMGYLRRRGYSDSVSRNTVGRLWEEMGRESDRQEEKR